jgi:uncharacterized membrane protein YdjX (TVP38/TMEM64 family)
MKNFRLLRNIVPFLLILALNIGIYVGYRGGYSWEDLENCVSGSTTTAIFLIIGLYLLKTVVWVIPISALYVGAGFLLPVLPAITVTYVGLTLDLTLSFYFGKYMGKSHVMNEIKRRKSGKWMLDAVNKNSSFTCFIIRMLPGPPTEVTNMLFGALHMQYGKFLILSILGMTPEMLPVIFVGKAVANPLSKEFLLPLLISLALAVGSTLIYILLLKKRDNSNNRLI